MKHQVLGEIAVYAPTSVSVCCPGCRQNGTFHGVANAADVTWLVRDKIDAFGKMEVETNVTVRAGTRICPNPECRTLIFVVTKGQRPIVCYPAETIDFDSNQLPKNIVASLEEAILCCAAGAYRATALMVRRVLEEVCADKNVEGRDLKKRIASLGGAVLIPAELLDAADELRILGNDAAHIEAREYDGIGKDEAELAIDLAKEILKATYQYGNLVARLRDLKKATKSEAP